MSNISFGRNVADTIVGFFETPKASETRAQIASTLHMISVAALVSTVACSVLALLAFTHGGIASLIFTPFFAVLGILDFDAYVGAKKGAELAKNQASYFTSLNLDSSDRRVDFVARREICEFIDASLKDTLLLSHVFGAIRPAILEM